MLPVDQVMYFKADGYLVEIHQVGVKVDLIEKSLNKLEQILPERFIRVHRSFIVDMEFIHSYRHKGNGSYEIRLKNEELVPMSPVKLKTLKQVFSEK
jgi:two-component system response regulator LytT